MFPPPKPQISPNFPSTPPKIPLTTPNKYSTIPLSVPRQPPLPPPNPDHANPPTSLQHPQTTPTPNPPTPYTSNPLSRNHLTPPTPPSNPPTSTHQNVTKSTTFHFHFPPLTCTPHPALCHDVILHPASVPSIYQAGTPAGGPILPRNFPPIVPQPGAMSHISFHSVTFSLSLCHSPLPRLANRSKPPHNRSHVPVNPSTTENK